MSRTASFVKDESRTHLPVLGGPAAVAVGYVALYVMLEGLSHVRPLFTLGITPWSPQAGLTLAFLLALGGRWWPVSVIAVAAGELLVRHAPASSLLTYAGALWVGCAYAAIAAFLRRAGLAESVTTAVDAARLAAVCLVGVLLVAAGYVGLYVAAGLLPAGDAVGATARSWVGQLNGVLAVTPLLLVAPGWQGRAHSVRAHARTILGALLVIVVALGIVLLLPAADQLQFFYLLFVPIIWIALRWRWRGALLAVLLIQAGLLVAAEAGIPTARFIDLQFLMLTLTLTALLLGAVVSERTELFQRMVTREAEQRALLAMAPDAVLVTDVRGTIREANAAASRLFGERAGGTSGRNVAALIPALGPDRSEGRAVLTGRRGDGVEFPAEVAWARLDAAADPGFLVIVRDVTERLQAEEQLRERDAALAGAMRFAVAGELASALAHELDQPITALVSYLRACEILANPVTRDDARLKDTLGKSIHEAIRAASVLHRLRDFYQGAGPKRERVYLPDLCSNVAGAFKDRLRRADAVLELAADPATPFIEADSTQIEIVLHNLLANALDAITRRAGGPRRIAMHVSFDRTSVVVRVEDSGPGVATDVQRKLFDPFVTDKTGGMGLGLAISQSLVQARGGNLSFASSSQLGGAAFTVRLPVEFPSDARSG